MATLLANMVNPEVMADMINQKLVDKMLFAPLATVDNTLVGNPGNTITVPHFNYIGDAATLAENTALTPSVLSTGVANVTIQKIAKGVELTDEAMLSGFGDPVGETASQLALAIASGVDNEMLSIMHGLSTVGRVYNTVNNTTYPTDVDIIPALELFGEDIEDGPTVAVVSPAVYTAMRSNANNWIPASNIAAQIAVRGAVGEYQGCQVIVSNKLKTTGAGGGDIYLVKPGALRLFLKRDTLVESARDVLKFTSVFTASKHFAAYIYDESKIVRIYKKA